jgi:hypothetical protein
MSSEFPSQVDVGGGSPGDYHAATRGSAGPGSLASRRGLRLAEREAQGLRPGVEELDLEEPLDDGPGLTDQLVHPLIDQRP